MKGRESGMPEECYWETFFDPYAVIAALVPADARGGDAIEFGCGYGTFTLPLARCIDGLVTTLDVEADLVLVTRERLRAAGIDNARVEERDFVDAGTGLPHASQAHALVYNLLHIEQPVRLLREAHRVLRTGASISVMHWRSDIETPRGPPLAIRPTPEQCAAWLVEAGFIEPTVVALDAAAPFHFGLVARLP